MPRAGVTAERATAREARALFESWFCAHSGDLRAYTARLTGDRVLAEDVVQETFARAWAHMPVLAARPEVRPWLFGVARNLCMDDHRLRRRTLPVEGEILESGGVSDELDPARRVEVEEEYRFVRDAIAVLGERHREALFLHDVEGVGYSELAARHGLSEPGVRAVISQPRRHLRDQITVVSQGALGVVGWCRSRLDELTRRVAERAPRSELLTASLGQYAVAVAAVAGVVLAAPGASAEICTPSATIKPPGVPPVTVTSICIPT